MKLLTLELSYWKWHYGRAFLDIFGLWMNFLRFTYNFFSLSLLVHTFFSPWRRLHENREKKFDFGAFFSSFIVNLMMRVVGALIRVLFIFAGTLAFLFVFILGIISFVVWLFLPIILALLIIIGFGLIFF